MRPWHVVTVFCGSTLQKSKFELVLVEEVTVVVVTGESNLAHSYRTCPIHFKIGEKGSVSNDVRRERLIRRNKFSHWMNPTTWKLSNSILEASTWSQSVKVSVNNFIHLHDFPHSILTHPCLSYAIYSYKFSFISHFSQVLKSRDIECVCVSATLWRCLRINIMDGLDVEEGSRRDSVHAQHRRSKRCIYKFYEFLIFFLWKSCFCCWYFFLWMHLIVLCFWFTVVMFLGHYLFNGMIW